MRWNIALRIVIVAAFCSAAPAAFAADPEFCEDYARSAVHQARTAREICRHGIHGPAWSAEYRGHFDWCLRVHRSEARAQQEMRHDRLEECRHQYH